MKQIQIEGNYWKGLEWIPSKGQPVEEFSGKNFQTSDKDIIENIDFGTKCAIFNEFCKHELPGVTPRGKSFLNK